MEYFVVDLFDLLNVARVSDASLLACSRYINSRGDDTAVIVEPVILLQIAFRSVWQALLGCGATKLDFQGFVGDCLEQGQMAWALRSVVGTGMDDPPDTKSKNMLPLARSMAAYALRSTSLRAFITVGEDAAAALAKSAAESVSAVVSDTTGAAFKALMVRKWMDRFAACGGHAGSAEVAGLCQMSLPNAYASLIANKHNLQDVLSIHPSPAPELQAAVQAFSAGDGSPKAFYAICESIMSCGYMTRFNVATGMTMSHSPVDITATMWSVNECLRQIMTRDLHFASTLMQKSVLTCWHGGGAPGAASEGTLARARLAQAVVRDMSALPPVVTNNMPSLAASCIRAWVPAGGREGVQRLAAAVSCLRTPCRDIGKCIDVFMLDEGHLEADVAQHLDLALTEGSFRSPPAYRLEAGGAQARGASPVFVSAPFADKNPEWRLYADIAGWIDPGRREGKVLRFWLPRLDDFHPEWCRSLNALLLNKHLHSSGLLAELVFLDFLAHYSHALLLEQHGSARPRRLQVAPRAGPVLRAVVAIDTRANVLTAISVLVALANLQQGSWGVVIATTEANRAAYEAMLAPHLDLAGGHVRVCAPEELQVATFDRDAYNAFLKSPSLWGGLLGCYDEVLTVQDDGFLLRKGLEDAYCGQFDYVGAPWAECEANASLEKLANPQLVGNGGLSFRNVKMMSAIAAEDASFGRQLFLSDTTPLPEDVFYSGRVHERGGRVCDRAAAARFSVEQVLQSNALGLHRFWAYFDAVSVARHCAGVMSDFRTENPKK